MSDMPFDTTQTFIAGEWRSAASNETLSLENPSDGTELTRIARGGVADIDRAVAAARDALAGPWGRMTAAERGRLLAAMGRLVLEKADELARLEALDVGKPLRQAKADALALARYLEFYGGAADKLHGETIPYQQGYTVLTLREPHGVTGHIVPWNYPMQIIGRSVGAALAMGNATVLKPAEEACLTALAFARIAEQAGLPGGGDQCRHRAWARKPARRFPPMAASTTSPSPDRSRPVPWCRPPPPAMPSPSPWSSAANRPRSSSPMPISMPPCPSSSMPASRMRARPAPPPRGS